MPGDQLRQAIRDFLRLGAPPDTLGFETHAAVAEPGHERIRISYENEERDRIPAFLLLPHGEGPFPAIVVHHQHNGERHLGKSEVCGLAGDPFQAFGPALARRGIAVLAPDSICFEDRRTSGSGLAPAPDPDADWLQHYNALCYRLLRGDTLMRRVIADAACGVSVLRGHDAIDRRRIGTLGHSYGGNTVLFHAALDQRLGFACASGAACSYDTRIRQGTGIEMAEVIPGFLPRFDIADLVRCIAPRRMLLVSATEDRYSCDADRIAESARAAFAGAGVAGDLEHRRYRGGHALTQERFDDIVSWLARACSEARPA